VVAIGGGGYLITGAQHHAAARRDATSGAAPAATVSAGRGTATLPSPPADVTAVEVDGSAARISWRNTEPVSKFQEVVISPGSGQGLPTEPFANHSPQVFSGLKPGQPYCFAVGYVYALTGKQAKASYSIVTSKACINGGTPNG